nr:VWA domain-containing protein [Allomuricauda sp.]
MEIRTALLIILSASAALTIVFYQYFYKNPKKGNLKFILGGLRFLALFAALLLLVNPKLIKNEYFLEKSNLILLVDDSSSMGQSTTAQTVKSQTVPIVQNERLQERFNILQYTFGNQLSQTDSFAFSQPSTQISDAVSKINELLINSRNSVILFTDGNQNLGRDYEFLSLSDKIQINTFVVGDTTSYEDISIDQVNINSYAFLRNKFPVEFTVAYKGTRPISKMVSVRVNGERVFQERVTLNENINTQTISTLIEAESVGLKSLVVNVAALENERNVTNNSKEVGLEVIDEKTNVLIISDILHPDIGALRKSIESNEQRKVIIEKPSVEESKLEEADLFILYQPNNRFREVYQYLQNNNLNFVTITGTKTDWRFLNQIQQSFFKENYNQTEEIIPVLNPSFSIFGLEELSVDGFPPLLGYLGDLEMRKENEAILSQRIRGVDLDKPLFCVITEENQREALLLGENIWRWRAKTYLDQQNFKEFDDLIGKLVLYLTSSGRKSRLELEYDPVIDGTNSAAMRATYFDNSYSFNPNGVITIRVTGRDTDFMRESPMLLKGSFYESDLSDLQAGTYDFSVSVKDENLSRSGSFRILDFNPENQPLASNYQKLRRLSEKTGGTQYFIGDSEKVIADLMQSRRFVPIEKSKQNVVSLIDFKILLGLIALSLALEWFIRKYNGLI